MRTHRFLASTPTIILWVIVFLWTLPTIGLLVNSFRPRGPQLTTGWWTAFQTGDFTLDNYRQAVFDPPGGFVSFGRALVNSFAITIPATVVPILMAAAAAYAFAWMPFKGRSWLFIGTVTLMAIPLQMAFVPLLQLYGGGAHWTIFGETITLFPDLDLLNKPIAVWLTHTAFGLPLAIFLLHNYISSLPADVFEAATIDGANHFGIFWRIVLPLSKPALAAFAIFQFLWVWNDYLVALIFLSQNPNRQSADDPARQPRDLARPRHRTAPGGGVRVDHRAAHHLLLIAALLRSGPPRGLRQRLEGQTHGQPGVGEHQQGVRERLPRRARPHARGRGR